MASPEAVRAAIEATETQLLVQIKKEDKSFEDVQPDQIKTRILEKFAVELKGRRIRNLIGVWSDLNERPERLKNLWCFLTLKKHFKPADTFYEDPKLSEAERTFLNSLGISTPPPQDFLKHSILAFDGEDQVDVYFMVHCNLTLINNLLFTNWNAPELKQILLVNYHGYRGHYGNFWYGCRALQGALALALDKERFSYEHKQPKKCPLEAKELYSYSRGGYRPFPVCILNFPISLPDIDRREPHSKWCFAPSYLKSNREGLVDVSTFDHLTSNLDLIRKHFAETGFTQEYLGDIEKALEGRKIRRLKILGYRSLAKTLHFIQQIAFFLNIKDHFDVTEVIAQEEQATEFDIAYLNSIGISTPPADECDIPEEGLRNNEVTLIYMRQFPTPLRSNIIKANQNQLRKLVIIMDTYIGQGTEWYNLLSEEGKKLIDERDEKWRKVFPNSGQTDNESHLQAFSRKAQSFPLRYDHFDLPAPTESFSICPFFGMDILSYPEDRLCREGNKT